MAAFPGASRGATLCATCIAVADFNGDGKPDIAYAATLLTPVAGVVLGNGDGTFRPGEILPLSEALQGSPFAADFNGDGKVDLVISGYSTSLFFGNGDGTFSSPIAVGACSSTASPSVSAVADFNRDGKADLICGTTVLLSNGDGTFRTGGTAGSNAMESFVLTADFNNDGNPDVLLRELSGQFAVALGHATGPSARNS